MLLRLHPGRNRISQRVPTFALVAGLALCVTASAVAPRSDTELIPRAASTSKLPLQFDMPGLSRLLLAFQTWGTNPYYSGYNPYYSGYNHFYGYQGSRFARPYYSQPYYGIPGGGAGAYGFGVHPAFRRPLNCYSFGVGGGFVYTRCW